MTRRGVSWAIVAAGVAALAPVVGPAFGQGPASALRGHNTNAPIDVEGDRIEVLDRQNLAILSGNVVVRQAQLRLNSARITVNYAGQGNQIQRIAASGGVTVTSPSETARSQTAIYDTDQAIITMLGNVVLTQGDSNVRGGRLVLDLETGRAVMDGGVPGAPGSATSPTGRVTARFSVRQGERTR